MLTWEPAEGFWDGRQVGPIGPPVVDGRLWDAGDQIALLGLGLSRAAPFRAATFHSPDRLVVDVVSGAAVCGGA